VSDQLKAGEISLIEVTPEEAKAASKPESYARIGMEFQPRRKKSMLTIKPALVIWLFMVCV